MRTALRRMFGLSRDLMIRSIALMSAYAYFAAQGSRMGEVALAANAILLNLLMIGGLLPRRHRAGGRAALRQGGGRQLAAGVRRGVCAVDAAGAGRSSLGLAVLWFAGGWLLIDVMTTNEPVRAVCARLPLVRGARDAHQHAGASSTTAS